MQSPVLLMAWLLVTPSSCQFMDSLNAAAGFMELSAISWIPDAGCQLIKSVLGLDYTSMSSSLPDTSRLELLLYSNDGQNVISSLVRANLSAASSAVQAAGFNGTWPLVVVCHDFLDAPSGEFVNSTVSALLARGGLNVMALDASSMIGSFYLRATTLLMFAGEQLGRALADINAGAGATRIHLIGHSLGAHTAAAAGRQFQALRGRALWRLSALDPARLCLEEDGPLAPEAADFVDVIHSDTGAYGAAAPAGHADFFPNGGEQQPDVISHGARHQQAWKYYTESILTPSRFPARLCPDWETFLGGGCDEAPTALMGYGAPTVARGSFYLITSGAPPYGLGTNGTSAPPATSGLFSGFSSWVSGVLG